LTAVWSHSREPSAAAYILAIAGRRDPAAFAALFSEYAPKVKAVLARRGPDWAEELTQEVMLTVWRKAGSFNPARGAGEAWIYAIARNASIDAARRERGQPLLQLNAASDAAEPPRGDVELQTAQVARRVQAAMCALSHEQRQVVRLAFFDERPHGEIATALGLPLGTVKSRLRLAMKRLRRLLTDVR
jgi:RNA polymerase sigma-70 factor (ECF subfamily)